MLRRNFLQLSALPLLARADNRKARMSCILLNLTGGPSQLDTWDMKPDAPAEVRGPFRPIRTNVPGIEISEIFPRMARIADKYTLIRSVYHDGPAVHETGMQLIQTGHDFRDGTEYPHAGDVVAGGTASVHVTLPAKNGFVVNCRKARELVETGTRFVTVNMHESVFDEITWDSHGSKPFSSIADYGTTVGPVFDRAYSSLIEDLHQRGLLPTTLVVAAGEFGRTPKINPAGGRDHWPQCWTVVVAGGGVAGGEVYGSSDCFGAEPWDNPVHASRLVATIYRRLGLASEISPLEI